MMDNNNILGILDTGEEIVIRGEKWKFLAQGQGHIILQNTDESDPLYNYVLSICKHQINVMPQQLHKSYDDILNNLETINKYLLKRNKVTLSRQNQDNFSQLVASLTGISLKSFKVHLSENLTHQNNKWHYLLQFKPKTPLPDIYSSDFLLKISEKYQLSYQQLLRTLKQSPPCEKLRWFKKNCFKKVKNNMNSLDIFSIFSSQTPNYLAKLKALKEPSLQSTILTDQKIDLCIKSSKILQEILKLQLLHNHQNDFSQVDLTKIWQQQTQKDQEIKDTLSKIHKELDSHENVNTRIERQLKQAPLCSDPLENKNSFERILRFLTSWSWRDSSLVIRFRLGQKQVEEVDIKIIDYEMKQASKLKETIRKDESFLQNYLKFKKII